MKPTVAQADLATRVGEQLCYGVSIVACSRTHPRSVCEYAPCLLEIIVDLKLNQVE